METILDRAKRIHKKTSIEEVYSLAKKYADTDPLFKLSSKSRKDILDIRLDAEKSWIENRKPYVLVYNKISKGFHGLDISRIKPDDITYPHNELLFKDETGRETLLIIRPPHLFLAFYVPSQNILPMLAFQEFSPSVGLVGEPFTTFGDLSEIELIPSKKEIEEWIKTVVGTGLLFADDEDQIIKRVLLSRDKDKILGPQDLLNALNRAKNRGNYGFTVGESIEQNPHFRNAHPALFWTGKNRSVPKIKIRSGCVVKRNQIVKVNN